MSIDVQQHIVNVEHVRKVYHRLVALDDISFAIDHGEAFGFLGPNGAGKSTLVKILTGQVTPTAGMVRVCGEPVSDLEARKRVGYVPELPSFHRWLQAREYLTFHGHLYGLRGSDLAKRVREVLALVGLTGREKQKLGTLSKGMLQRIGLAQALLNRPDLLILDELVSGLDPVGQREMREMLRQLKADGVSILLNSHQLTDMELLCDRVAIIHKGRILKVFQPAMLDDGVVMEILAHPVGEELLRRLGAVALAVQHDERRPDAIVVELENEEQVGILTDILHDCGARIYELKRRHSSLEQLFIQTINASGD